ncbi:MAG: hypothetical protein K5905_25080 [Roseibium sp.]|uniref:hypothetical protein n=1 Tax=Roseibium sp. TaxID=1936156 RepID=UPI0026377003|nr:hypothetical protein [Roseibium sp.]MCV0428740.1 hypothetical protein [Roseibium sp.]
MSFYSYLEYLNDRRIDKALDVLKRREATLFVDARTKLINFWIENETLLKDLKETQQYTDEIYIKAASEILDSKDYVISLHNLSLFYNNAVACALDGICDPITICGSLSGEIQEYLSINRGYFAYAMSIRDEDARSMWLHMPEFMKFCERKAGVRIFSRHDRSSWCQSNVVLERWFGLSFGNACSPTQTKWDERIEDFSHHCSVKNLSNAGNSPAIDQAER